MVRFGYLAFGYGLTKCATSKAEVIEVLQQDTVSVSIHRSGLDPNAHGLNEPLGLPGWCASVTSPSATG